MAPLSGFRHQISMHEHAENTEFLIASKAVVSNAIYRGVSRESFESHIFNNVLCELDREIGRLVRALRDVTLIGLHIRNIFELYLICKHMLSSKDAFSSWMGQMHKDAIEIQRGFVELLDLHGRDATEMKNLVNFSNNALEKSPFESKRGFNIKELADAYGYSADYSSIYKLCSKLLHPTSIKVNAYDAFIENENYVECLMYVGVYFCKKFEDLCREIVLRRNT